MLYHRFAFAFCYLHFWSFCSWTSFRKVWMDVSSSSPSHHITSQCQVQSLGLKLLILSTNVFYKFRRLGSLNWFVILDSNSDSKFRQWLRYDFDSNNGFELTIAISIYFGLFFINSFPIQFWKAFIVYFI